MFLVLLLKANPDSPLADVWMVRVHPDRSLERIHCTSLVCKFVSAILFGGFLFLGFLSLNPFGTLSGACIGKIIITHPGEVLKSMSPAE